MSTKPIDFRKGANGLAALIKEDAGRPVVWRGVRVPGQAGRPDQASVLVPLGRGAYGQDARAGRVPLGPGSGRGDAALRLAAQRLLDGLDWVRVYRARCTRAPIATN